MLEKERAEELNTLASVSSVVREHMRLLTAQRDSDRLYLEYTMKSIHMKKKLEGIIERVTLINRSTNLPHEFASSGGPVNQTTATSSDFVMFCVHYGNKLYHNSKYLFIIILLFA